MTIPNVAVPSPGFWRQYIAANIEAHLRDYVEKQNLGLVLDAPFDVAHADNVVLQPDVLYLSRERFSLLTESCLKGMPNLVVEVFSPAEAFLRRFIERGLLKELCT